MRPLSSLIIIASAYAATVRAPGAELTFGPWQVRYSANGVESVAYRGSVILTQSSFTVFQPDYRGAQFSMMGSRVTQRSAAPDAALLQWDKEAPGICRGSMSLDLSHEALEWRTTMRVLTDAPVEVGVLILPATVASAPGVVHCRVNGRRSQITEEQFPRRVLSGPVVFDTPAYEWRFETDATSGKWLFQDRRDSQKSLRLIACLRAGPDEALEAETALRLSVRESPEHARAGRERLLAQRAWTLAELEVANAGFEDEPLLSGWSHSPATARIEDSGVDDSRCARLTVAGPDEKSVYLTQRVPVKPNSRYSVWAMVRAQDVRRANVLGMKSCGAVLVVEWARADGEWLAPGAYADGRFGTAAWHRQSVGPLVAPPKARYAIIFLGLRGLGTAWFDKVQFFEYQRAAVLMGPLDGTELAQNRPLLRWQRDPTAEAYRVQAAPDPRFAAATTVIDAIVDQARYMPTEKLTPGRWYWRVGLDSEAPGAAWSFVQTAPGEADTTGPEVVLLPQSLLDSAAEVRLRAVDESGVDWAGVEVDIDGAAAEITVRQQDDSASISAAAGWPRGARELTVRIADKHGNRSTASSWIVCCPAPPVPYAWTRDRGVFNGTTYEFPLGIYQVQEKDLSRVKEAGFDLVHIYNWEGSQDDAAARRYLDAVHRAGLRAFVGFDRGANSGNGLVQGNFGHVARRIAALRDHPGLFAWYLFDEPDLSHQYVPPKLLRAYYDFIKALDPQHPVIVTLAVRGSPERYGRCYDVYWSMVYRTTDHVAAQLAEHRAEIGDCPLMAIVHAYDREQSATPGDGGIIDAAQRFQPDERTLRANALMAIVRGSSGLVWWRFGGDTTRWLATSDLPAMWDAHQRVATELRSIAPRLVASGRDVPVAVSCTPEAANVQARLKLVGESVLLIAVNAETEPVTVRLSAPELRGTARLRETRGNRTLDVVDGSFVDRLEPLAARVYRSE